MIQEPTEESKKVFISDRLFNGRWDGDQYIVDIPLWDDEEGYETIVFSRISNDDPDWNNLIKWMSSPEGIHAVKQGMVERKFSYKIYTSWIKNKDAKSVYGNCCIFSQFDPDEGIDIEAGGMGETEAEAVLAAAYKALARES